MSEYIELSIENPVVVGRCGNWFLVAQSVDLDNGNNNGPAQIHYAEDDKYSLVQPLQVFYKWAVWEPATQDDYEKAVKQITESVVDTSDTLVVESQEQLDALLSEAQEKGWKISIGGK